MLVFGGVTEKAFPRKIPPLNFPESPISAQARMGRTCQKSSSQKKHKNENSLGGNLSIKTGTPLKTNMTVENPPFEDVFPIGNGDVPMLC